MKAAAALPVSGVNPANQSPAASTVRSLQDCISSDNHNERAPSAILRYTRSKNTISMEARKVTPEEVKTLMTAVKKGEWNGDIFLKPHAYSILLQAYLEHSIDPEQFINTQQLLEFYTQFGIRKDLPHIARLHGEVTRFDLNDPQRRFERDALIRSIQSKKTKNEMEQLFNQALDCLKESNTPAWVDAVVLTDQSEQRYLDHAPLRLERPTPRGVASQKQQILNWTRTLRRSATPAILSVEMRERKYNFFPTHSIHRCMQYLSNSIPVDLFPFYGTVTADQLREQREQNIHPRACFHPLAEDNLSSPHGTCFGTLEGTHDEYHGHLLSRIPENMRALLIDMDRKEQALQQMIAGISLKSGETVLDHLPKDFIAMEEITSCPLGAKGSQGYHAFHDVPKVLTIFSASRPFLDQECINFPISADEASDIHFANAIAAGMMDIHPPVTPQPETHIHNYVFRYRKILKWHWMLYQYRCHNPQKLVWIRDVFATTTHEIRKREGSLYNWNTFRKSGRINYQELMCLLGDLANAYARDIE